MHHTRCPSSGPTSTRASSIKGYEAIRSEILARQIELGFLPEGTELSGDQPPWRTRAHQPRRQSRGRMLDTVRPWATLSADEQRLFARMAEVFAGYISYWDDRIGRMLDYLEESGQLDNTIIVVISDNGASGEGGPNGEFNEWRFFNGLPADPAITLEHIDELGTPESYNHYNTGWAWAFDTPFPYWKRWAGAEGGVADMCMVSWPAQIEPDSTPRQQYTHAVDVVPTIYDLLGIEPPETIKGTARTRSKARASQPRLTDPSVPGRRTQFYAMLGQRSIYHDGWLACTVHPPLSGWGSFEKDEWELFHLETDRAQTKNVAADHPDRVEALKGLWFYYAGHLSTACPSTTARPSNKSSPNARAAAPNGNATSTSRTAPTCPSLPVLRSTDARTRSLRARSSSRMRPKACCTRTAASRADMRSTSRTSDSSTRSTGSARRCKPSRRRPISNRGGMPSPSDFVVDGPNPDPKMPGFAGTATLYIDDEEVGSGPIVTQPGAFCLVGRRHLCRPRQRARRSRPDYADRGTFEFTGGTIEKVIVDVTGEHYVDHEAQVRAWLMKD